MELTKTTYTNLRENLASFLVGVLDKDSALEIVWRNNDPCIILSKKHYIKLVRRCKNYEHVQELFQKLHGIQNTKIDPTSSIQMDLFD